MVRGTPPVLVTPPASPLVPLADLRDQCRIDGVHEDHLLALYEGSAVSHLDGCGGVLGRAILPQTWRQDFPGWGRLRLALPDVRSVTVTWLDDAGDEQPADSATLIADTLGSCVDASGPPASRVRVVYEAGMPDADVAAIRQAVLMTVAHWHAHREAVVVGKIPSELPMAAQALVAGKRRVRV